MSTGEPSIAWLIVDMRKMHIDGATNAQLCGRATEIHDRLEKDRALAGKDKKKLAIIQAEQNDFDKVVREITDGRDHPSRKEKAMQSYFDYVRRRKKKERK